MLLPPFLDEESVSEKAALCAEAWVSERLSAETAKKVRCSSSDSCDVKCFCGLEEMESVEKFCISEESESAKGSWVSNNRLAEFCDCAAWLSRASSSWKCQPEQFVPDRAVHCKSCRHCLAD